MTTRQFKRTVFCIGVAGLWLALTAPAFAARDVNIDLNPGTSAGGVNAAISYSAMNATVPCCARYS
jgi:hypothetical protein